MSAKKLQNHNVSKQSFRSMCYLYSDIASRRLCVHKKYTFGHHLAELGNGPGLSVRTTLSTAPGQNGPLALPPLQVREPVNKNVFVSAKVAQLVTIEAAQLIRTWKR